MEGEFLPLHFFAALAFGAGMFYKRCGHKVWSRTVVGAQQKKAFYHLEGELEGWLQDNYPIEKGGLTKKTW